MQRFRQRIVDIAGTWGLALVVVAIGFVLTYQFVDPPVNPVQDKDDLATRLQRLERLDTGLVTGSLPKKSCTDDVYKLRRDIDLVR